MAPVSFSLSLPLANFSLAGSSLVVSSHLFAGLAVCLGGSSFTFSCRCLLYNRLQPFDKDPTRADSSVAGCDYANATVCTAHQQHSSAAHQQHSSAAHQQHDSAAQSHTVQ